MSCFFKFYNSLYFTKVTCSTRQHVFSKLLINSKYFKIAAPGKGLKPSREEYIAESKFALLGILSKRISNDTFLCRFQWTTRMEVEIINILSFRHEKHCANVGRLANATLRHYSESSKHSRNSLGGRLSCNMLRLKTSANVSSRVAVLEFRLKHANNENILCNYGLAQENQLIGMLNHCVGSSNTSTRMQKMFSKLANVCSDWDFQHMLCSYLKF